MSYTKIGPIIESWASKHNVRLMTEDGEPGRRYFYMSSKIGETFQIVIEPERGGSVRMDGHMIESPTDEEAHFTFEVPVSQTENVLDLGLGTSQAWFNRHVSQTRRVS